MKSVTGLTTEPTEDTELRGTDYFSDHKTHESETGWWLPSGP